MEPDPRAFHEHAESAAGIAESGLPAIDPPVGSFRPRPAVLVPTEPRSLGAILRGFEPFGYLVLALAGVTLTGSTGAVYVVNLAAAGASPPSFTIRPVSPGLVGANAVHAADVDRNGDLDILAVDTRGDRVVGFGNNNTPLTPPLGSQRVVTARVDDPGRRPP